jgi:hypothetical protein
MKSRCRTGWSATSLTRLMACALPLLLCGPVDAHDPAPRESPAGGAGRTPTLLEPVPALKDSLYQARDVTHFEFIVGAKHGVWLQEVYEIGAITEGQYELRLAVVRAYEPGAATAHITEATALRVDLTIAGEAARSSRGWLDAQEVTQLVERMPGMTSASQAPPMFPGDRGDRQVQVVYPRGGVTMGLRTSPREPSQRRLMVQVGRGRGGVTAHLQPERFSEMQALVNSAHDMIKDVQDKRGHHN